MTAKEEAQNTTTVTTTWSFPEWGVAVEAETYEEAVKQAKKLAGEK